MNVLGITGRNRDAAAALAVDGQIVAAATEDSFARVMGVGYALTGGFPHAAAEACLRVAGLKSEDVHELAIVEDLGSVPSGASVNPFTSAKLRTVDPVRADAIQAAMSEPDASVVVVCGANPPVLAAFSREGDRLGPRVDISGANSVVQGARSLAALLGLHGDDPFAALDRLSVGADPEFQSEIGGVLRWAGGSSGVSTDAPAMEVLARRVAGDHAASLADVRTLNARAQHMRRALAASFMSELAGVMARVAESANAKNGSSPVGVGGGVFGNARFNTELTRLAGSSLSWSPVPEAPGRALGAAASMPGGATRGLALGPSFSEEDIKRTLDNCRLDYVYEPDWTRLLTRVSRMLAQGKVVGWFQGAMTFGPRTLGSRSILSDPSSPYARQNLNEYLRNLPLDEPLPVVFAPSQADRCVPNGTSPAPGVRDAEVSPECRQSLAAALDWRQSVRVHGGMSAQSPRLADLLELHFAATGTPGLIEANLAGTGEPVACTPRDAVRTVYSSAIDALVIGRFLLMKDYWLLRTQDK